MRGSHTTRAAHGIRTVAAVSAPMRFTDRPTEMAALYETIGLRRTLTSGGYAVLSGRGGAIALHPLSTADTVAEATTSFVLFVDDAAGAVEALTESGVEARWWDESWGRQAEVASPLGLFSLDTQDDTYGYVEHEAGPSPVEVVQTVVTDRTEDALALFGRFGFGASGTPSPGWIELRSDRPADGAIGVHAAGAATAGDLTDRTATDANGWLGAVVALITAEPLDALAARLAAAGHPTVRRGASSPADGPDRLELTDPDGQHLEIHAARAASF